MSSVIQSNFQVTPVRLNQLHRLCYTASRPEANPAHTHRPNLCFLSLSLSLSLSPSLSLSLLPACVARWLDHPRPFTWTSNQQFHTQGSTRSALSASHRAGARRLYTEVNRRPSTYLFACSLAGFASSRRSKISLHTGPGGLPPVRWQAWGCRCIHHCRVERRARSPFSDPPQGRSRWQFTSCHR